MKINEIFCSLNGESELSGFRTVFIRTYGCNCACVYCDTTYSWQGNEFTEMTIDEIVKKVESYNCKRVTLTGGEPTLQQDIEELILALSEKKYHIEIETNGAVDLRPIIDHLIVGRCFLDNVSFTMDWKCPSSGAHHKMIPSNLRQLDFDDVVKCVVQNKEDLDEAARINELTCATVYLSPVFGKIGLVDIANYLLDNEINDMRLQVQLHKIIWDSNARGV